MSVGTTIVRVMIEDGLSETESTTVLVPRDATGAQIIHQAIRRCNISQKTDRLSLYVRSSLSTKPVLLEHAVSTTEYLEASGSIFELRSLDRTRVKVLFQEGLSPTAQKVMEFDFSGCTAKKFLSWVVRRSSISQHIDNLAINFQTRKLIIMGDECFPADISAKDIIEIRAKGITINLVLPDETTYSYSADFFRPISNILSELCSKLDLVEQEFVFATEKKEVLDGNLSFQAQGIQQNETIIMRFKKKKHQSNQSTIVFRKGTSRSTIRGADSTAVEMPRFFINMLILDHTSKRLKDIPFIIDRNPVTWLNEFIELGGLDVLIDTLEIYGRRKRFTQDQLIIEDILQIIASVLNKDEVGLANIVKKPTTCSVLILILDPLWSVHLRIIVLRALAAITSVSQVGFKMTEAAFEASSQLHQKPMFYEIIDILTSHETIDLKIYAFVLVNALCSTSTNLQERIQIRDKFIQAGLSKAIPDLRAENDGVLDGQLNIFSEEAHLDQSQIVKLASFSLGEVDINDPISIVSHLKANMQGTDMSEWLLIILQRLFVIPKDEELASRIWQLLDHLVSRVVQLGPNENPDELFTTKEQLDALNASYSARISEYQRSYTALKKEKEQLAHNFELLRSELEKATGQKYEDTQTSSANPQSGGQPTRNRPVSTAVLLSDVWGPNAGPVLPRTSSSQGMVNPNSPAVRREQSISGSNFSGMATLVEDDDGGDKDGSGGDGTKQSKGVMKSLRNSASSATNKLLRSLSSNKNTSDSSSGNEGYTGPVQTTSSQPAPGDATAHGAVGVAGNAPMGAVSGGMAGAPQQGGMAATPAPVSLGMTGGPPPPPPPPLAAPSINSTDGSSSPPPPPPPGLMGGPPPPPPPGMMGGPPPPPPGMMGGPPPPPGMMAGIGSSAAAPRLKPIPKPSVPMKQFNWVKIPPGKISKTFWSGMALDDVDVDFGDIEDQFKTKVAEAKGPTSPTGTAKGTTVNLLETKRSNNIGIMIARFKVPHVKVKQAIVDLDDRVLSIEDVKAIATNAPTQEELEILANFTGDVEELGNSEKFLIEISPIPRLKNRLEAWSFKRGFDNQLDEIIQTVQVIQDAALEMKQSDKFKRVMGVVLYMGNFLNGTSFRGNASGFKIESLIKMMDTKASDNRTTLLVYLVRWILKNDHQLKDFGDQWNVVEKASKLFLSNVESDLAAITKSLQLVKSEVDASAADQDRAYYAIMSDFFAEAAMKKEHTMSLLSDTRKQCEEMLVMFGEEPKSPPEEFFVTVTSFKTSFGRALRDIEMENEKAKKAANPRMTVNRSAPSSAEKKAGMDNLISQLQAGSTFKMRRAQEQAQQSELGSGGNARQVLELLEKGKKATTSVSS